MARIGAKQKIRDYLKHRVGEITTAAQLKDVVGPEVTEWARRLRELRSDEGWKISSHHDRADLKPGQYILEEAPPAPGTYIFASTLSNRLRADILERNGYTCQMCGIGAGELMDDGRKARLHVGHIIDRDHGGSDAPTNLRALCSQCNQGAKNLTQEPPSYAYLFGKIRTASIDDQERIFDWLQKKLGRDKLQN